MIHNLEHKYYDIIAARSECYSYVTIYDDRDLSGRPIAVLCDPMTGKTIEVDSPKITVSLFRSYTGSPPGQRSTNQLNKPDNS